MTHSDDTHENGANITPEEMRNELRYLRAENTCLKATQRHLLGKKRQELKKERKSSRT